MFNILLSIGVIAIYLLEHVSIVKYTNCNNGTLLNMVLSDLGSYFCEHVPERISYCACGF